MRFQGAVLREQNQIFAVVAVKKQIVENRTRANGTIAALSRVFRGMPVVLLVEDDLGRPQYYGRRDIARFLSNVPLSAIRWKEYTIN